MVCMKWQVLVKEVPEFALAGIEPEKFGPFVDIDAFVSCGVLSSARQDQDFEMGECS